MERSSWRAPGASVVPVRVLAAAAASWRCAVLACGPYDSEARLLAAARRRADLLWYARVCVRAERPEGPWTLVADLPAPRTEADHCEPCTTWHRQPMHSPRATCHEGSHTDVLESLRSLLSPLLACAFSSHHSWLGLAGVDGTCAGEDPFLFIDKRGAFHILAHVYGVQQYPLNPISGPRKNSSSLVSVLLLFVGGGRSSVLSRACLGKTLLVFQM
jgi:hypothetical protein